MKKILGMSLLALTVMIGTNAVEAVDADGDARIDMVQPLSINQVSSVDFGTVAVDGAGFIDIIGTEVTCEAMGGGSILCSETGIAGQFNISGKANTNISISTTDGILTHNDGSDLTFQVSMNGTLTLDSSGNTSFYTQGSIEFTGTESEGEYSTTNAGGIPYVVTAVYP